METKIRNGVMVAEAVTIPMRPGVATIREYKIITGRALRIIPQRCPRCGADPEIWGTSSVRCSGQHCHIWGPECKTLSAAITEWNRIRIQKEETPCGSERNRSKRRRS